MQIVVVDLYFELIPCYRWKNRASLSLLGCYIRLRLQILLQPVLGYLRLKLTWHYSGLS